MFVRMMVRMLTQFSFLVGGKIHYIHVNIFKFFVLYSALIAILVMLKIHQSQIQAECR